MLKNEHGRSVETSETQVLWRDRRIVLILTRHIGCRFCRQQVSSLSQSNFAQKLQNHDISLVLVSLGKVEQIAAFRKLTNFEGEIWVDDSTDGSVSAVNQKISKIYESFDCKRGPALLRMDTELGRKFLEDTAKKFPDFKELADVDEATGDVTKFPGDVYQIGGAFVLGPGNSCDFSHRSQFAGDHVSLQALYEYATGEGSRGEDIIFDSTEYLSSPTSNKRNIISASLFTKTLFLALTSTFLVPAITSAVQNYVKQKRFINATNVKLLTPIDIDAHVLQHGFPECDCGATMSSLPVLGKITSTSTSKSTSTLQTGRRGRTTTWATDDSADQTTQGNEYQALLCFVREFLAKPHPEVGRGGPVCPFVPKSLKMNSIYFSVVRTSALVQDSITEELEVRLREILIKLTKDFIPIFQNLEPNTGKLRQFKAVILCFPDVLDAQAHSIIDAVQVAVKPFFVSKGLMVGEFHKNNNNSGLRNPNFFPLRTPFPCLALRHMVPGDVEFMNLDEYDDSMCISLLNGFLDVFGADEEKEQVIKAKRLLENLLKKNT